MRLLEHQQLAVVAPGAIPQTMEFTNTGVGTPAPARPSTPAWSPARVLRWLSAVTAPAVPSDTRPGVLILGSGLLADTITAQLRTHARAPYRLVGSFEKLEKANGNGNHGTGNVSELEEILVRERVGCIAVAIMSERRGTLPVEQLLACKMKGIRVEDGVGFYERIARKIPLAGLNPSFFIFNEGFRWPTSVAKRLLDVLFSVLCLIIGAPFFAVLPLLIKLTSPGPVLYRQERVGLNGKRFTMLKFRSMVLDAEGPGRAVWASENDPRVTLLGAFMRKFRLDELPQVVNVFRGEMSFVGPRPERPEFVDSLRDVVPYYAMRHTVKPGITGWAQVMYRYGASVQDTVEKLQYDLYYIKHMSLWLDCRVFLKTFRTVLFGVGGR